MVPLLATPVAEGYTRSYKRMLTVMSLAELEEVVEYYRYRRRFFGSRMVWFQE